MDEQRQRAVPLEVVVGLEVLGRWLSTVDQKEGDGGVGNDDSQRRWLTTQDESRC
jgi:hypothetical protein